MNNIFSGSIISLTTSFQEYITLSSISVTNDGIWIDDILIISSLILRIEFGKFNIIKGRYWDDSELKVTVKNTSDTSIKFYFKIEARDAEDNLIDSDTFYTKTLDAGASGEYTIFDYVSSSKYEKMSAEDVKYVVVMVEEN